MIKFSIKMPELWKRIDQYRDEIMLSVAASMQTNRGFLFDKSGAYNGHEPWAPLTWRKGQPLVKRGTLRQSMAPMNADGKAGRDGIAHFTGSMVTIGTKLFYARLMNDGTTKMTGGVLKPVNAKALKIPLPQGKQAGTAAIAIQSKAIERQIYELQRKLRKTNSEKSRDSIIDRIVKLQHKLKTKDTATGPEKFIFRKSVKIPARPFDTWTQEDQEEMEIALCNKIAEVLSRG